MTVSTSTSWSRRPLRSLPTGRFWRASRAWGRQAATTILAELPAVERLPSAQSAAVYCGLASREFRSGISVRKRTRLRKALFLSMPTAVRFNPLLQGFFARLVDAGKPKMQAVRQKAGQKTDEGSLREFPYLRPHGAMEL